MRTLQDLLDIELPIIQAPMAGSQRAPLALAVAAAGGLGSLPGAMFSPDALEGEIATFTSASSRPLNVNFFCHEPPLVDAAREVAWRRALAPYYAEFGIDPAAAATGPTRAPFDHAMCDVLERTRPAVVSFHFGLPSKELLARVRSWRPRVLASATTVSEAKWLEAASVDAIIAQGSEAGGHRGMFLSRELATQQPLKQLLPQIVAAVHVPVIAAGGIAEARDVAAAFARGAAGVQVGTAYLRCPEAATSTVHREALRGPSATPTAITNLFTGRPARGIVNRFMRELGPISGLPPAFPLAAIAVAPLRSAAEKRGSGDFSPLWAGERWTTSTESPAAEVTRRLAEGLPDTR